MRDDVMAYVWVNIAAENGSTVAEKGHDELFAKLNASERRLAVKLSKQCHEKPASCPKYSFD